MRPMRPIFLASFLFSFHLALLMYLNSTVIGSFGSELQTTLAYALGSMLSLVALVMSPRIVRKAGSTLFLLLGVGLTVLLLWLLGASILHPSFVLVFILYFSLNVVVWYGFDLLFEHYSRESIMGNIRGLVLTLDNTGVMLAPVVASLIIGFAGFAGTYFVAALITLVSFIILSSTAILRNNQSVPQSSISEAFKGLLTHQVARRIVTLYFILQFFYAWMVLYMAPYLLSLGFTWSTIGIMFSIMLAPFVLLQYGVGALADRFHAEPRLIVAGFFTAALATLALAFPLPHRAIVFTAILFATRIGASIIEVACESAFFKHVKESDLALIGTLRMTMPLAYIIAPLCGALILTFTSVRALFGILAVLLAAGATYALRLKRS